MSNIGAVPLDVIFLMLLIFLQFNSHVPCMRALDEMFSKRGTPVQLWWARRRSFYDRSSLGLYAFCFYSYALYQIDNVRSILLWERSKHGRVGDATVRREDR